MIKGVGGLKFLNDQKKEKFLNNFSAIKGFYNLTPYDNAFGFSVKRKLNGNDKGNVSLLGFFISSEELNKQESKKLLNIRATYGKESDGGVTIRSVEESRISDPVDLESKDYYYYDIGQGKFFEKKQEIYPLELLESIYNKHTKSTQLKRGLWLRIKLFFWRILMKNIFIIITKLFYGCLYIITGDRYLFEPILEEETLNNKIISSKLKSRIAPNMKENIKEGKKIEFLGYKTAYWSIIFYSASHLFLYIIFMYKNFKPELIVKILENNFLTLIYVILSLWVIEMVVPKILKIFIRVNSKLSINSLYKKIKI